MFFWDSQRQSAFLTCVSVNSEYIFIFISICAGLFSGCTPAQSGHKKQQKRPWIPNRDLHTLGLFFPAKTVSYKICHDFNRILCPSVEFPDFVRRYRTWRIPDQRAIWGISPVGVILWNIPWLNTFRVALCSPVTTASEPRLTKNYNLMPQRGWDPKRFVCNANQKIDLDIYIYIYI